VKAVFTRFKLRYGWAVGGVKVLLGSCTNCLLVLQYHLSLKAKSCAPSNEQ
jgi:hypothetical protein